MARLHDKYKKDIVPALAKRFGRENVLALPRLSKIVLNMGVGRPCRTRTGWSRRPSSSP